LVEVMQMVVLSSWADLGYGKVGPRNACNSQETVNARLIARNFARRVNFEMKDDTSGVWIRDPGRVKTLTVPDAVRIEAVIDAAQSTLPAPYSAADALASSPYAHLPTSPAPSLAVLRQHYGSFKANPRSAKGTYDLAYAVSSCSINELSDFLRNGRVEMWRGDVRLSMSVSAPFVWRCLSGSAVAPFPHPAHRTGRADFPHPALGQDLTPSFACDAIGSF
jgi:hypothetical protein